MRDLVVAMTGASGALYAVRLLEVLLVTGHTVHLTISPSAATVLDKELGLKVNLKSFDPRQLLPTDADLAQDPALQGLKSLRSGLSDLSSIFRGLGPRIGRSFPTTRLCMAPLYHRSI